MPMSRGRFNLVSLVLLLTTCTANTNQACHPYSCGQIRNIRFPFRLKTDPDNCGPALLRYLNFKRYELACENNQTILYLNSKRFYVQSISYENNTIRVLDPGIRKNQCSSFPFHSLTDEDIRRAYRPYYYYNLRDENEAVMFINCTSRVESSVYVDTASCETRSSTTPSNTTSSSSSHVYSYVLLGKEMRVADLDNSCMLTAVAWFSSEFTVIDNTSLITIVNALANGFSLYWYRKYWGLLDFLLGILEIVVLFTVMILLARFLLGLPCLLALLVYKCRRQHLSDDESIEDFLQGPNILLPIRYKYRDIKKMTNNFKDKLGEGGYGSVFKGKLRSGPSIAVKIMNKSKASGQEFINEVATIGRIHHVNVVRLIGFCVEGSKRALIYEFMPNGSLEKYIFSPEERTLSLSYEKTFEISLGVARGINYLHRGCDMQILHFDIKPHNILLDQNFTPKVSDFGLVKLYPTDDSIVSLTAARGTIGYMAPELFYKNIGGVSYKADIYSYGMLLMEMAGRRKNLNPFVENLSQIYFPSWVYDQFNRGKEIGMGNASGEDRKMVKKMILVALWCIQMKPVDRPSMNKIVEMLEGDDEHLQMPPKPFLYPEESPAEDDDMHTNDDDLPLFLGDHIDSS